MSPRRTSPIQCISTWTEYQRGSRHAIWFETYEITLGVGDKVEVKRRARHGDLWASVLRTQEVGPRDEPP